MTEKNKDFTCLLDSRIKSENDRKEEQGRSMVEMLGVLAIVGVLSVGGIAGYTYAMNKYYANELLAGASERAVLVTAQIVAGRTPNLNEFAHYPNVGGTFGNAEELEDGSGFVIAVSGVKGAVCENLIQMTEGTDIVIADTEGNQLSTENCDDENPNDLVFVFETGMSSTSDSGAKEACENGNPYLSYMDDPCGTEWGKPTCSTDSECSALFDSSCCHPDLGICVEAESCEWDDNTGIETCICKDNLDKCTSNSDCASGEFCNLKSFSSDSADVGDVPTYGACESIGDVGEVTFGGLNGGNASYDFIYSSKPLTWWAAENWCKALEKPMLTLSYQPYVEGMVDCNMEEANGDCQWFVESFGDYGVWLGDIGDGGAYRLWPISEISTRDFSTSTNKAVCIK